MKKLVLLSALSLVPLTSCRGTASGPSSAPKGEESSSIESLAEVLEFPDTESRDFVRVVEGRATSIRSKLHYSVGSRERHRFIPPASEGAQPQVITRRPLWDILDRYQELEEQYATSQDATAFVHGVHELSLELRKIPDDVHSVLVSLQLPSEGSQAELEQLGFSTVIPLEASETQVTHVGTIRDFTTLQLFELATHEYVTELSYF